MLNNDRRQIRDKASAMDALMKSPKLSQYVENVWNSTPGSTDRARARSVLRSIEQANKKRGIGVVPPELYDGKGGPGPLAAAPPNLTGAPARDETVAEPAKTKILAGVDPVQNIAAPSSTATPTADEGKSYSSALSRALASGQSAPEYWTKSALDAVDAQTRRSLEWYAKAPLAQRRIPSALWGPSVLGSLAFGEAAKLGTRAGMGLMGLGSLAANSLGWLVGKHGEPTDWSDTEAWFRAALGARTPEVGEVPPGETPTAGKVSAQESPAYDTPSGEKLVYGPPAPDGMTDQEYANQKAKDKEDADGLTDEDVEQIIDDTGAVPGTPGAIDLGYGAQITFQGVQTMADTYGEDFLDSWFEDLDPSAQEFYKDVYDAVKGGMGAKTFSWQIMSDPNKLAAILGVPVEALRFFPQNGFLAEHLIELRDLVKRDFHLDELSYNILQKTMSGAALEDDLASYIRGKDAYLTNLEKLISDTQTAYANMDTSNPHVKQRMDNFQNYLTILHGRQNQRYIDLLDSSVTQHNAEIDRLTALYNFNFDKAKEEFDSLAAITQEQFTRIQGIVEDLYTNVEAREQKYMDKLKWESDMMGAGYDNYMKSVEAAYRSREKEADIRYKDAQARKAEAEALAKESGDSVDIDFDAPDWEKFVEVVEDDEGNKFLSDLTYSPSNLYQYANVNEQDVSLTMGRYQNKVAEYIKRQVAGGNEDKVREEMFNMATRIAAEQAMLEEAGEQDSDLYTWNESFTNILIASAVKGMEDYFNAQESRVKALREAIVELTSTKGWWITKRSVGLEDREAFMDNYVEDDKLTESMAKYLFDDVYSMSVAAGRDPASTFTMADGTNLADPSVSDNTLVSSISASYWSR